MARLLAGVNSVSYLIFSTIGIPNVERWGRRKMIMYAAAGQCFCYLIITILIQKNEDPSYGTWPTADHSQPNPQQVKVASASVAFFFLYYVFFGIGFQGVRLSIRKTFPSTRMKALTPSFYVCRYHGSTRPKSTAWP